MWSQEFHDFLSSQLSDFLRRRLGEDAGIRGCSVDEVDALERECGTKLPDDYRSFLIRAGRGARQLWVGFNYTIADVAGLQQYGREQLAESHLEAPKDAFFFISGQGVQLFFFTAEGVFFYQEGDDHYEKVAECFTDFLFRTNDIL